MLDEVKIRKLFPGVPIELEGKLDEIRHPHTCCRLEAILFHEGQLEILFNLKDLVVEPVFDSFFFRQFSLELLALDIVHDLARRAVVHIGHVLKECEQAVIVRLRNRILLVVMAAGTTNRHAHDHLGGRRQHTVKHIIFGQQPVGWLIIPDSKTIKTGG